MRRRLLILLVPVAAAALIGLLLALMVVMGDQGRSTRRIDAARDPAVPDPDLDGLAVPDFRMVDQHGTPVDASIFDGRITIVDFMFTNCPLVCPMMTGTMAALHESLAGAPVLFLSISVDPQHDTPDALRAWGERYNADFTRWRFLVGTRETVDRLLLDMLAFQLREDADTPVPLADGTAMTNIIHPQKLVLVGPDRRVLGLYNFQFDDEIAALERRARSLSR